MIEKRKIKRDKRERERDTCSSRIIQPLSILSLAQSRAVLLSSYNK